MQYLVRNCLQFFTLRGKLLQDCINENEQVERCVVVIVVTPFLPRDGGTARTAIQVHAVNPIEVG